MTNRYSRLLRFAVFILLPVILLVLPAAFFDEGRSWCLSVILFNKPCYACGLTRAAMHLIHLDFADAYYFNPLIFAVFPLLAAQWAIWFWNDFQAFRNRR